MDAVFQKQRTPEVVIPFWPLEGWGCFSVESRPCDASRPIGSAGCSMAAPLKHLKQIGHFLETLNSRSLNFYIIWIIWII